LKALGINILRAAAFKWEKMRQKATAEVALTVVCSIAIGLCRSLSWDFYHIRPTIRRSAANNEHGLYLAA
jgi:hypothetical protein